MNHRVCFLTFTFALLSGVTAANEDIIASLTAKGATFKQSGGTVNEIKVNVDKLDENDYQQINQLTDLRSISLSGKRFEDRHLAMLSDLVNLESFSINGTILTDEGYRHFEPFKKLRSLALFHPSRDVAEFTGSGLAHLESLPALERLTFAGATAGDTAMEAVGTLQQLKEFRQWHNWESRESIGHLKQLDRLTSLKLGQRLPGRGRPLTPSLDDATLALVADIPSLEILDLQEARLTYAGLERLKSLPRLQTLKIKWVDISESDIAKFKQWMPHVQVVWEPMADDEKASLLEKKLKL